MVPRYVIQNGGLYNRMVEFQTESQAGSLRGLVSQIIKRHSPLLTGYAVCLYNKNKKYSKLCLLYFGCGTRIRTQTKRVRVACATLTQFRITAKAR